MKKFIDLIFTALFLIGLASCATVPKDPTDRTELLRNAVKKDPGDVKAREKFFVHLGIQMPRFNDVKVKAEYAENYFWLVEHAPMSTVFSSESDFRFLIPGVDGENYEKALGAWDKAVEKDSKNAVVLGNAAGQFWRQDKKVIQFLEMAQAIEPQNSKWYFQLGNYQLACSYDGDDDHVEPVRSKLALIHLQKGVDKEGASNFPFGIRLPWAAWGAGDLNKAKGLALDAIDKARNIVGSDSTEKVGLHFAGHSVLGLLDLKKGDVKSAMYHLIAAVSLKVAPEQIISRFAFELPRQLLEKGENEAVMNYLDVVSITAESLGRKDQVVAWISMIKEGKKPDFHEFNVKAKSEAVSKSGVSASLLMECANFIMKNDKATPEERQKRSDLFGEELRREFVLFKKDPEAGFRKALIAARLRAGS